MAFERDWKKRKAKIRRLLKQPPEFVQGVNMGPSQHLQEENILPHCVVGIEFNFCRFSDDPVHVSGCWCPVVGLDAVLRCGCLFPVDKDGTIPNGLWLWSQWNVPPLQCNGPRTRKGFCTSQAIFHLPGGGGRLDYLPCLEFRRPFPSWFLSIHKMRQQFLPKRCYISTGIQDNVTIQEITTQIFTAVKTLTLAYLFDAFLRAIGAYRILCFRAEL
jgi:hypothetical protein